METRLLVMLPLFYGTPFQCTLEIKKCFHLLKQAWSQAYRVITHYNIAGYSPFQYLAPCNCSMDWIHGALYIYYCIVSQSHIILTVYSREQRKRSTYYESGYSPVPRRSRDYTRYPSRDRYRSPRDLSVDRQSRSQYPVWCQYCCIVIRHHLEAVLYTFKICSTLRLNPNSYSIEIYIHLEYHITSLGTSYNWFSVSF